MLSWPLQVGPHQLVPVDVGWGMNKVHLAEIEAVADYQRRASEGVSVGEMDIGPYATFGEGREKTLCGRSCTAAVAEADIDLLGEHRHMLCQACWRKVESWLSPPEPAHGEDDVVRWVIRTVLETGEAMLEEVPVPRLEPLRRRIRSELKGAIGGSVRTAKVGEAALWIHSRIVLDAKTEEQLQHELRAAVDRVAAIGSGVNIEAPTWRKTWSEIVSTF